jgi:hypothetical protein
MKQKIRKYILLPIFLLFIGSGVFVFNSLYWIASESFPVDQLTGEQSGWVFYQDTTKLFVGCGSGSVSLGYHSGTHSIVCMTYEEIRNALAQKSIGSAKVCESGKFLVGFSSTGQIECDSLK